MPTNSANLWIKWHLECSDSVASGVFRPRSAVSLSTLCRLGVAVDLSSVVMAMDTSEVHSGP